jgi:hypothetical protein
MAQDTVSLDQVINDFILSIEGDDYINTASEVMVRNLALRGIREMGFDILKRIKSAQITIDQNNGTGALPADYVDMLKIGTIGSDGLFYVFGENKNINLAGIEPVDDSEGMLYGYDSYLFRNYVYATTDGRMYGMGGGFYSGEYRIDNVNNRIELTSDSLTDNVYMEYVADEARAANPTIHIYAEEALRRYIYWYLIQRKASVPMNEKERARRDYYNELRLANSRLKSFSKEEALKTIRKNFKQSPKY